MWRVARYYGLWLVHVISGVVAALQIFGLLPAVTWLLAPGAITTDLVIKIAIKLGVLIISLAIFRWAKSQISEKKANSISTTHSEASEAPSSRKKATQNYGAIHVVSIIGCILLALLFTFVWPTKYRYDHVKLGANDYPTRTNRFTDETEILRGARGWTSVSRQTKSSELEQNVTEQSISHSSMRDPSEGQGSHGKFESVVGDQSVSRVVPLSPAKETGVPIEPVETTHAETTSREEAIRIVESFHPDWDEIRHDPRYAHWLNQQEPSVQALASSNSYEDAIRLIDLYKTDRAAGNVR